MEGRESHPPPLRGVAVGAKGKRKAVTSLRPPLPMEKPTSLPSMEVLISNSSLFEKPLLKDVDEEVISLLRVVYGEEVLKRVQELLNDATPFQMMAMVSIFFYLC